MTAERIPRPSIALNTHDPLVGLFVAEDGDTAEYFVEERRPPGPGPSADALAALSVIGAWSDMDWHELEDGLDRIRHQSRPTPPIDLDHA